MSHSPNLLTRELAAEIDRLSAGLQRGELTAPENERLNSLLITNPAARQRYIRGLAIVGSLEWNGPVPASEPAANGSNPITLPTEAISASLSAQLRQFVLVFAVVALATIVIYEKWLRAPRNENLAAANPGTLSPTEKTGGNEVSVAYLASVNGCSWGDTPTVHTVGSNVRAGDEIFLEEGIAEFRLANGVIANVEGPASLLLGSSLRLVLQQGKLTVRVPWGVKDFSVIAGECRVIATDAEIGIAVAKGSVEVHSFVGETRLAPLLFSDRVRGRSDVEDDVEGDFAADSLPFIVSEGRSAIWQSAGKLQSDSLLADRSKFASKLSMGDYLPATQQYVDAVIASRPVSYWRFEAIDKRRVLNEVRGAQPLAVVGDVSLSGDSRNRFLELGSDADAGHLVSDRAVPLSGKDYTVELWCKPSHFHRGTLVSMGLEPPPKPNEQILKHAFMLQTMRDDDRFADVLHNMNPGGIRFLHRNPPTRDPRTGTSCYTRERYQVRRWQHVVAVKEEDSLRIYVDGVVTGTAEDSTEIAKGLRVMVGKALFRKLGALPTRAFCGQLDELAIYNRALGEQEIVSHFKAIDFTPKKTRSDGDRVLEDRAKAPAALYRNADEAKLGA
jgi:hypothetical protein